MINKDKDKDNKEDTGNRGKSWDKIEGERLTWERHAQSKHPTGDESTQRGERLFKRGQFSDNQDIR